MKASELRAKDAAGLEKEVSDLLKAHFGLRMQKATQQLTNHSQLKNTRRDIARAKTVLTEKALGLDKPAPAAVDAKGKAKGKSAAPKKAAKKAGAKA